MQLDHTYKVLQVYQDHLDEMVRLDSGVFLEDLVLVVKEVFLVQEVRLGSLVLPVYLANEDKEEHLDVEEDQWVP